MKPKRAGRKKLPKGQARPRLACTVAPGTLKELERRAELKKTNLGRLIDEMVAVPLTQ